MDPTHRLRFSELFRLSLRTFKQKPIRAILTILGMSVGIATVVFLVSLGYGLQYILIGKLVSTEDSLVTMEISYPSESSLTIKPSVISDLVKIDGVSEVIPVGEFSAELKSEESPDSIISVAARVIEPGYYRLTGLAPDIGKIPDGKAIKGVVITGQTTGLLNFSSTSDTLGKKLDLKIFYQNDGDVTQINEAVSKEIMPISGIISDDTQVPMVIVYSSDLDKEPSSYQSALVKAGSIDLVEPIRDKLINMGFLVSARIDLVNQARKILNIITIVLGVFGITALVVSAIGMFNTMIVGFLERIYEVGILKSIGATDSDVEKLFLMESSMMGLLGGGGGVLIGYLAGKAINIILSILAVRLGGKAFELFITPAWFAFLVICISISIGLVSGFWPARRASKLSPKEAFINR